MALTFHPDIDPDFQLKYQHCLVYIMQLTQLLKLIKSKHLIKFSKAMHMNMGMTATIIQNSFHAVTVMLDSCGNYSFKIILF